jgi:hypothetical protein
MDQDEHDETPHADGEHADGPPGADGNMPGAIDIVQLAAKVRTLMQDELRLEKARGAGAAKRAQNG